MPFVSDAEWEIIQRKLACIEELEKRITALEARLRRYENPHTPSSMQQFHSCEHKSYGKPGREKGHVGVGRSTPSEIDEHKTTHLKSCPRCGGPIKKRGWRKRYTTDIRPGKAVNTEHDIERGYCAHCDEIVEPVITEALPNSRFGLQFALYVSFLSVLGITLGKIRVILLHDYGVRVSKGALANTIEQLADYLGDDYEKLKQELLACKDAFADETSQPTHGKNAWLWTFVSQTIAYLAVDKSRGQKVAQRVLGEYKGILHSDFWSAYNVLSCLKQKCFAHLKRDLHFIKKTNKNPQAQKYVRELRALLAAAKREIQRSPLLKARYENKLYAFMDKPWKDKDCMRLNKRLRRHASEIFTFLETETETTNNRAERSLRPAVIKRKNTYGSYSMDGAQAHAIMMSFYQTTQLQGLEYEPHVKGLIENRLQNSTGN